MTEAEIAEWRSSPVTAALVRFLRRKQAGPIRQFLMGAAISPVTQGEARAYNQLETLIALTPDELRKQLDQKDGATS